MFQRLGVTGKTLVIDVQAGRRLRADARATSPACGSCRAAASPRATSWTRRTSSRRERRSRSCRRPGVVASASCQLPVTEAVQLELAAGAGTDHETDRRHPPAAHHREDDAAARGRPDARVRGGAGRDQGRHQARGREAARLEGRGGADGDRARQDEAPGALRRPALRLEEGLREAPRRREGSPSSWKATQLQETSRIRNADSKIQADVAGPAVPDGADRSTRSRRPSRTSRSSSRCSKSGGREQPRRADLVVARRRPQAQLPDHRLQARQARHPGDGLDGRVRPEPLGAHRAADLRRRREALHPAAGGPRSRATRSSPATTSTSCRATRCRSRTSRSARRCTTWSCGPAGRPDRAQRGIVGAGGGQGRRLRAR